MTENLPVVPSTPSLPARQGMSAKLEFARMLAEADLLPAQYRKKPANVLYALEYGEALGISAMAAITGVHVIEGKPSASAGLIGALVRRAGHRLRITGDSQSATATIWRSDDPQFPFEVTWTMDMARAAGLANKGTWKSYPGPLLRARALTQAARDACEEVLFGLHYTAEEISDVEVDRNGDPTGPMPSDAPQTPPPLAPASPVVEPAPADVDAFMALLDAAWHDMDMTALRALWTAAGPDFGLTAGSLVPDPAGELIVLGGLFKMIAAAIENGTRPPEQTPAAPKPAPKAAARERKATRVNADDIAAAGDDPLWQNAVYDDPAAHDNAVTDAEIVPDEVQA